MGSRIQHIAKLLYRAAVRWQTHQGAQLAAAVAYSMALSFFPLLLVLLSIGGWLIEGTGVGHDARQRLIDVIAQQTDPSLAEQVDALIGSLGSQASTSGPAGLLMLILGAMLVFAQFEAAFDRLWEVKEKENQGYLALLKSTLWDRFRAFLMLLCVGLFMIAGFMATMVLSGIVQFASRQLPLPPFVFNTLTVAAAVTLNWLLFTIIYWALPKATIYGTEAVAGGLLASLLWETGRHVLAGFVIGSKYGVYGLVGAFIAMMLWVYYAVAVILFGAAYVQVLSADRRPHKPP